MLYRCVRRDAHVKQSCVVLRPDYVLDVAVYSVQPEIGGCHITVQASKRLRPASIVARSCNAIV